MGKQSGLNYFIGFSEVAGYYKNLYEGFDLLGINCGYLNKNTNKFKYRRPVGNDRIFEFVMAYNVAFSGKLARFVFFPIYLTLHVLAFIRIVTHYDVIIIHNGSTLMRGWDVPLYRKFGLKVIVISLGSDSRPPIINGALIDDLGNFSIDLETLKIETQRIRARVRKYESISDFFISSSSYCHFNENRIINLIPLGFPSHVFESNCDLEKVFTSSKPIKVLHAPTRAHSKGSEKILKIVKKLSIKYPVEIVLLEGVPNDEVLGLIRDSDIIVDQLYSDMPSPGFASEAVGMGKLVFVCGYYANFINQDVSEELLPTTIFISPDKLYEELEKAIKQLLEGGSSSREGQSYSLINVAKRFEAIMLGKLPESYWFDPCDVKYLHGYGKDEMSQFNFALLSDSEYRFYTGLTR